VARVQVSLPAPIRQNRFRYAFENGADFCVVGMFDFQIAEDVAIANQVVKETEHRARAWMA
jgi:hypothetical protein